MGNSGKPDLRPRRSCEDHLHPSAVPNGSEMVPRVGFEPTSPRLQRGAFTRLDRVPVKLKHNIRRLGRVLHETQRRWRSSVLGLASARPNLRSRGEGADRAGRAADHISSERAVRWYESLRRERQARSAPSPRWTGSPRRLRCGVSLRGEGWGEGRQPPMVGFA